MRATPAIKPIETAYKGYRFRSRLEARWAAFLDSVGEEWEYEKEGYELPSGRYLPDFWLPRLQCWLEIKGVNPTASELKLCEELAFATERTTAIAWGLPQELGQGFFDEKVPDGLSVFCYSNDCYADPKVAWYRSCLVIDDSSGLIGFHTYDCETRWGFRHPVQEMCLETELVSSIEDRQHTLIEINHTWTEVTFGNDFPHFPGEFYEVAQIHFDRAKSARFEFTR